MAATCDHGSALQLGGVLDRAYQQAGKPANRTSLEQAKLRTNQTESRAEQAKSRAEAAETRTEQAEHRIESAKTRTDQAETRTEQAESRAEQAETRAEQAETRAEQAETALDQHAHQNTDRTHKIPTSRHSAAPADGTVGISNRIDLLTTRQREVFQLIAQGQNTKQIAGQLQLSPKTVEYHRLKLMAVLNVHDIPGLVRMALRVGFIS